LKYELKEFKKEINIRGVKKWENFKV
jgi:hypothetical protein